MTLALWADKVVGLPLDRAGSLTGKVAPSPIPGRPEPSHVKIGSIVLIPWTNFDVNDGVPNAVLLQPIPLT